jgi:hypothetical protein
MKAGLVERVPPKEKIMNEEPKSIWKKSWTGPHWLRAWLILVVAIYIIGFIAYLAGGIPGAPPSLWPELFFLLTGSLITATVCVLLWLLVRCFFSWRNFKRLLFGLACFATLIALFYAEEDWRGWHAWNQFKHEWEAKGEHFDFAGVIPPAVPDDQNFAMAPILVESMKAVLGPQNSSKWFGKNYAENGRTNFMDRLNLDIFHADQTGMPEIEKPKSASWQKNELTDLRGWQNYYRVSSFTNRLEKRTPFYYPAKAFTNGFPVSPQPQTPAQDVLLALSKYDSAIEELRSASRRPDSRFPLYANPDQPPFTILLPHLAVLKRCALALQLRTIAELQSGRSEPALDDVKLMLSLTGSIRTEPFLISHLVRIAMVQITLQPIYEGLAEHKWSAGQLAGLDAELAKLDFLADYKLSMRGEMGCHDGAIDFMLRNRREIFNLVDSNNKNTPPPFISLLIPSGWFYQNQFRCDRMMAEQFIPLADVNQKNVSPSAVRRAEEVLRGETQKITPYNLLEKMLLPSLGNVVKKFAQAQVSVDLARTAIALERCRLAHGEFPESLDALAPQFIAQVPHDVIGGQPLKYRREADGQFVLYSVGWNEKDDGGVVGLTPKGQAVDINKGDWVWRYPKKE